MLSWVWSGYNALPGLRFGYDDWTVEQFEKETGILDRRARIERNAIMPPKPIRSM